METFTEVLRAACLPAGLASGRVALLRPSNFVAVLNPDEHLARFLPAFLRDHPAFIRNVFLMMRFRTGPQYDEIHSALRDGLAKYDVSVLRADDKDYTGDLWENVCLYMIGWRFGVAVFEEIDQREFNPNVAFELAFMTAHGKRCLLLRACNKASET